MTDIELLHTITMPTRYQILMLLLEHHYCGKALAAKIGISEAAISQHLQILKDCGIVTGQRIDRRMHYQVNTELLIQSVGIFHQKVLEKSEHMPNRDYCDCELAEFCSRKGDVKK